MKADAQIPLEVLFGNPKHINPQISPDGKYLSYIAPYNGVLNIWLRTIGRQDDAPLTRDTDRGIRSVTWADDARHILYIQDRGGDENYHIYKVHKDTGQVTDMTPFDNIQAQIISSNPAFPDHVIIALNRRDVRVHDAYRLHIGTGEMVEVARNPGNFMGWIVDPQLRVLGALSVTDGGGSAFLIRNTEQDDWRPLVQWDAEDAMNSQPVSLNVDDGFAYLIDSRNANAARLVKLDIESGEIEVISEDPGYDAGFVIRDSRTHAIQAVNFYRSRMEWVVLDNEYAADFKALSQLDSGDFYRISRSVDDLTWTVAFIHDNKPTAYYLYHRESKTGELLFYSHPELEKYKLAEMEPIQFRAEDGLEVNGYVTFPPGKKREHLPTVLLVHGGPWFRDTWGYHPEVQWFANRGYLCIQVNFRGSAGYGKKFLNAGDHEWGGKMHRDLVNAVEWAVERGYANPEKIAIYGGSYGGYAALVGATFTPDLFCCAVDIVGPSNLITFLHSMPPYWSMMQDTIFRRIGNPETEKDFLLSRSPITKVDQIKIPMLIAQGANDPRVKQAEAEQIVSAMKEKGIYHEYMLFSDEGHGFSKPENRMKFYRAAEKFLKRYLDKGDAHTE